MSLTQDTYHQILSQMYLYEEIVLNYYRTDKDGLYQQLSESIKKYTSYILDMVEIYPELLENEKYTNLITKKLTQMYFYYPCFKARYVATLQQLGLQEPNMDYITSVTRDLMHDRHA
jgi:hypothetical protein